MGGRGGMNKSREERKFPSQTQKNSIYYFSTCVTLQREKKKRLVLTSVDNSRRRKFEFQRGRPLSLFLSLLFCCPSERARNVNRVYREKFHRIRLSDKRRKVLIPREWPGPYSGVAAKNGGRVRASAAANPAKHRPAARPASAPVKTLVGHEEPPKMAGRELSNLSLPPPPLDQHLWQQETHLRHNTVSMAARRTGSLLQQPTPTATAAIIFCFPCRTVRNQREQE